MSSSAASDSVLVIDQGTTSTRAIVFGPAATPTASAHEEFPQIFPRPGWVEHEPRDIWRTALSTARIALGRAADHGDSVAVIGIANQRETTLIWDRTTGRPIYNAIVWQDRRTADQCAALRAKGAEALVQQRSGLLLDPYFSASKITWLLDNVPQARARAERGDLAFGTIDTYLLWQFTKGQVHATDATNAARTALFDIHKGRWDKDLLKLFDVPRSLLPEVRDSAADFGTAAPEFFGRAIPIRSMIGDQQAALIGQACFEPGMLKSTFGTGAFLLLNTGDTVAVSSHRLISTIAYQIKGRRTYALEGAIFAAGATVQWLRDGLLMVRSSAETGQLAAQSDPDQPVYLVPAFVGLGAPLWEAEARATIVGITRGTTRREFARAALESVAYQTRDLMDAMRGDMGAAWRERAVLRVDGGMSASDWTLQSVADLADVVVERPVVRETTALGAAYLAGFQAGFYPAPETFARAWRSEQRFTPAMEAPVRERKLAGWRHAVAQTVLKP
jgi:glycerol kinase